MKSPPLAPGNSQCPELAERWATGQLPGMNVHYSKKMQSRIFFLTLTQTQQKFPRMSKCKKNKSQDSYGIS